MANIIMDTEELLARFGWADYFVLSVMLALSAGIGIFYGCFGNKMRDTKEFLMAGKSMTTIPVAMSLLASFLSAITLLGTPWEIYQNGFIYWLVGFSYIPVMAATAYIYIPVFWDLQLTSVYEYLEMRFNKSLRILASFIFLFQTMFYMALVIYAPSLALSQVTGINVYVSVCVITAVCVFYTTLGGIKAVIWTDVLQLLVMFGSMLFIIGKGTVDEGGFQEVWDTGTRGNRTELINWNIDPRIRHTFWTLIIGGYFNWICIYGVHQAQVQRYLCLKDRVMVSRVLWINAFGLFFMMIICAFGGLVIYHRYELCDPIRTGIVEKGDQVFPFYVLDAFGHMKGLPGLFVAGVFSGSLSSVSTGINSLATIVLEDFVKGCCCLKLTSRQDLIISKVLSFVFGVLALVLVFIVERQGNILSAAFTIFGVTGGPLHGLFVLGMFFPSVNSIGAFISTLFGLAFSSWVGVGKILSVNSGAIISIPKPTSIQNCANFTTLVEEVTHNTEATNLLNDGSVSSGLVDLYKISYLYYGIIGAFSVIIIGVLTSLLTGKNDETELNPKLLSPAFHFFKRFIPGYEKIGIHYRPNQTRSSGLEVMDGKDNPGFAAHETYVKTTL